MTSLSDEILEDCVKAEAHKPSQIISIAISVFEKKIDEKYKTLDNTNYDRFIAQKEILEELKQEIKQEK